MSELTIWAIGLRSWPSGYTAGSRPAKGKQALDAPNVVCSCASVDQRTVTEITIWHKFTRIPSD